MAYLVVVRLVDGCQVLGELFDQRYENLRRRIQSRIREVSRVLTRPMKASLIGLCSTIHSISRTRNTAWRDTHANASTSARIHSVNVNLSFFRSSCRSSSLSSSFSSTAS